MKKIYPLFCLLLTGLLVARSAHAADDVKLWNAEDPMGKWRAFGAGMSQSAGISNGVRMEVDWPATTFGVGAVYGEAEGAGLPSLENKGTLVLEAKSSVEDGTMLAPEWVIEGGKKAFRVKDSGRAALTADWQVFRFKIPDDFPGLSSQMDQVKALRLLFQNPSKPGRAEVFFRDVRLEP